MHTYVHECTPAIQDLLLSDKADPILTQSKITAYITEDLSNIRFSSNLHPGQKLAIKVQFSDVTRKYLIFASEHCQIFLGTTHPNRKNIPNNFKIYQVDIKYTRWP
jgi:hypothetical protein